MNGEAGVDGEALRRLRHDIRSPLVVISGFAQLLGGERELTSQERRDYAGRIETAARDLQQLVNDIIGF